MSKLKSTPTGIKVLCVFQMIVGGLATIGGGYYIYLSGKVEGGGLLALFGFILLVLGSAYEVVSVNLWKLKISAWKANIALLVLSLVGGIIGLIMGNSTSIVYLIFYGAILFYLKNRKEVFTPITTGDRFYGEET